MPPGEGPNARLKIFDFGQSISLLIQDKNRDVIVSFPDVDPSFISIAQIFSPKHQKHSIALSRRDFFERFNRYF